MKSTIFIYPPLIYTLTYIEKLLRKIFFILWTSNSSLSKNLLFLSFQIVQKIQRAALQDLIHLSTKESYHPRRVSLIDSNKTHRTPKMENTGCHKILALFEWRKAIINGLQLLFTQSTLISQHPPFSLKLIQRQTFLQQASQVKKLTFKGIHEFQIIFKGKRVV